MNTTNTITIRIESNIDADDLKLILERLQDTNLECQVGFSAGCRILISPPKEFMRIEQKDL
jgi:hypothetical protein